MEKKKIYLLISFVIFLCFNLIAQQNNLAGNPAPLKSLWSIKEKKEVKDIGAYYEIALDKIAITQLLNYEGKVFSLEVEHKLQKWILDLQEQPMPTVKVKINNSTYLNTIDLPKIYAGKLRGEAKKNNCMLTVTKNYVSAQLFLPGYNIMVERYNEKGDDNFVLMDSREFTKPNNKPFNCGTISTGENETPLFNKPSAASNLKNPATTLSSIDKCNYVFLDCTKKLYDHFNTGANGIQSTIDHIFTLWNDVHTAYLNEQLNVMISEINIWTVTTPFSTTTREIGLKSFADYYKNNFEGNMAMLLDWNSPGKAGIAGAIGAAKATSRNVCGTYTDVPIYVGSYVYNDLNYFGSYLNFPTPVIADETYASVHELGHLFGSRHTHWCGWLGGPIDLCGEREGPCTQEPVTPPTDGGTFMSYCLNPMDFNNGFGQQPGDEIRAWVTLNACLSNCNCSLFQSIGTITQEGFYHIEASFAVTANGTVPNTNTLIKLDAGIKVTLQPGFKALSGSKVNVYIDGCGGIR